MEMNNTESRELMENFSGNSKVSTEIIENGVTVKTIPNSQEELEKLTAKDLQEVYKNSGEKVYLIINNIQLDDDTEIVFEYLFKKPKTASYDRYIKTINSSASKAAAMFTTDNVVPEQRDILRETLVEYPAMAITFAEKLLKILGLADSTSIKKL